LFGLILILGLGVAIVFVTRVAVHAFEGLNREVEAAIVAALGTAAVTLISVIVTRIFERRATVERAQQERRTPVYEAFVSGLLGMLRDHGDDPTALDLTEAVKVLNSFTEKVIVWGSDDVIRTWGQYRYAVQAPQTDAEKRESVYGLERLFLTVRQDLGHPNKGLKRGDLLRLFVNDLPEER
jgi:uncharacterized membrane-anchored protein